MKYVHYVAAFMTVALLSGCGSSRIDSGQLDYDNGTAYQHGSNKPFTGIVHFDGNPNVAEQVVLTLHDPAPLYSNMSRVPMDACDVAFKNGVMDGHVVCLQRNGNKTLSFDLHRGRLDGEAVEYNPTGGKAFDFNWSDGALQGDQAVYSRDGRYVVHQWHVDNGHKRGTEVRRYSDGDDLAEGTWSDDGKFSGTMFTPGDSAITTFKDGVKEGDFKQLDTKDPSLKQVAVDGIYSDGQRDGTWTYHGQVPRDEFILASRSQGFPQLLGMAQEDSTTVTWKHGTLSGPVKIYDKDRHVLLTFTIADGQIAAPIVRTDPESGETFTITDPTILAALNYASNGENPYLLATMGSGTSGPGGQAAVQQAIDAVTQERNARTARIEYVLDPVHHLDPTKAPGSSSQ
jgi:antitoxin component YwqK of YwqJK toxin-antitoxin module